MATWRPYTMVKTPVDVEISSSSSEAGSSAPNSPVSDTGSFVVQPKDDVVKKELRDAIRHKRLAKGLDELPEIEAKKPKTDELTPEEEEKRRLRRERNKLAAFRCRQRRKQHIVDLELVTEQISNSNDDLEHEIENLKVQKQQLEMMLDKHSCKKRANREKLHEDNKENSVNDK
ncbi:cyclic AMP-dependent transcription factor ATF-3-like [Xenia sp. Carnegie-2017]|uniref:cyclic AMP-dependent transcription factor ATF-3-like n=1 Tax=Xenia sp. Carnegie-2017 TaxID=2897299 RepID=UPI001F03EAF7|nr:cyclic AMP-dependent transcription factor ATF-3-like [Xenia sp. Carnegie-2017]